MADDKPKKAALYVRVSTMYQIDKDSLPVQRRELENYAKYALGIDNCELFEDAGYSGKNTSRPGFQQMMARIRSGEFSHLLVWKIDRISRNLIDFAEMYQELKDLGVTFVSKNEQFDTSTAIGEAMLKIILVFAELERKMTAERVTAVMLSRAESGKYNGGRIPYGYAYDKSTATFTLVEDEAKIIHEIFDRYGRLDTTQTLSRDLNARGLKTRYGAWNTTGIWSILTNPFYYGALRYNYRNESKGLAEWSFRKDDEIILIPGHHEAIVTKELFDLCQEKLSRNGIRKKESPKTYKRKNCHVFAGLITCGKCGAQYNATIGKAKALQDGYRPSIYLCSTRRNKGDCDNKFVSDETIGPFVLNYIANILRAENSFGKSTSIQTLQKKLLRGSVFQVVDHIDRPGLAEMRAFFQSEKFGSVEYVPTEIDLTDVLETTERDVLDKEKRRIERAIDRLKSAYLFSDDAMSETEYIVQRKELLDQLQGIDDRIQAIDDKAVSGRQMSDAEFIAKASYFALQQELLSGREVDFIDLIRHTDPEITRDFVNTVCSNFCVLDGKITAIRFKNGIEHRFVYKKSEPD